MDKSPLIEMAEGDNYLLSGKQREILRAAAAVILQMQALRGDIQERKIFWPAEVDFAIDALDSYEAACKEEPK